MRCKVHFLLIAAISCLSQTFLTEARDGRQVLLVSMDGFRNDYFEKARTPNFDAMMKSGVRVSYVTPPFIPEAFPSHHSMATGLYPESHGIVANEFYDPVYKKAFSKDNVAHRWWNQSEPIWVNAVKAGRKVGTFFWPGTEVNFAGHRPTFYRIYDPFVPFDVRIRTVVTWLAYLKLDLCIMYFEEPDQTGHSVGPDDPQLVPVIERMDALLGSLMSALKNLGVKDQVDVIVTSDHGMVQVNRSHAINIAEVFQRKDPLVQPVKEEGSTISFAPVGKAESSQLLSILTARQHITILEKEDMPKRLHYSGNRRISKYVAVSEEGWMMTHIVNETRTAYAGMHSYDNNLKAVRTIFVASGPSFKQGYRHNESIETVDIYPLLCHLLNLKPAPNNGSFERVKPLLGEGKEKREEENEREEHDVAQELKRE